MNVIINYSPARVAYTLGNLDALGNLQDPKKIIQYVNAYQGLSMTFLAPDSIEGYTFYGIPVHSSKCGNKPNAAPLLYLLMFDSNTEYCKRIRDDKDPTLINCISDTQIKKAEQIISKYRELRKITDPKKRDAPIILFSHQPLRYIID
jgi:hypothetical protein